MVGLGVITSEELEESTKDDSCCLGRCRRRKVAFSVAGVSSEVHIKCACQVEKLSRRKLNKGCESLECMCADLGVRLLEHKR